MLKRAVVNAIQRSGYDLVPRRAWNQSHPDLDPAFFEVYERASEFTMTSVDRMYGLWQAVRYITAAGVPGDYVECGVWRGGSSVLAARTLLDLNDRSRRLWLYDTYEGMNEPTDRDVDIDGLQVTQVWDEHRATPESELLCLASIEDVRANMAATGYPPEKIEYVQGKVEETIPARIPERIALLRLDTDWYESTRHEIEHLYPLLEPGGVLILDDYGHWAGAREAVDEYLRENDISLLLNRLDYSGRLAIKPHPR